MTNANMKLVVLNVHLADKMETPKQELDAGEFIVTRVIELAKLKDELNGIFFCFPFFIQDALTMLNLDYDKRVSRI